MSESLEAEYRMRGRAVEPKPTYNLGLAMCIVFCCTLVPFLAWLTGLGSLVLWIIYWIKIAEHKNIVTSLQNHNQESQIF